MARVSFIQENHTLNRARCCDYCSTSIKSIGKRHTNHLLRKGKSLAILVNHAGYANEQTIDPVSFTIELLLDYKRNNNVNLYDEYKIIQHIQITTRYFFNIMSPVPLLLSDKTNAFNFQKIKGKYQVLMI